MIDFAYSTELVINASPQAIFDIVSNPARHVELAGSDELNKVGQQPAGAVGVGTHLPAEETVVMADGTIMDLTADSVVVTHDAPNSFSWIVNPALGEADPPHSMVVPYGATGQWHQGGARGLVDWGDIQPTC